MPKSKKPKSIRRKVAPNRKVAVMAVILVASIASFYAVGTLKQFMDERQFKNLESEMQKVSFAGIETLKMEKECYELSRKFEKGPIYCRVVVFMPELFVEDDLRNIELPESIMLQDVSTEDNRLTSAEYSFENRKFRCSLNASYFSVRETNSKRLSKLECGAEVKKPAYELKS